MVFLRRSGSAPRVRGAASHPNIAVLAAAGRAAPEPLTLVLPALAALGSIASIAAVAWTAEDKTTERARVKRKIDVILKDLETSGVGLTEILKRIKRNGKIFGLEGPNGAAAMKFGLTGGRIDAKGVQLYHQLANDVATMFVLASQNSFDAVSAIEDGEIEPPEALLYQFAEAQDRLNGLLLQRAGTRAIIDAAIEISGQLTDMVRQLKRHRAKH